MSLIGLVLFLGADNFKSSIGAWALNIGVASEDIGTALMAAGTVSFFSNRVVKLRNFFVAILGVVIVLGADNIGNIWKQNLPPGLNKIFVNAGVGFITIAITRFIYNYLFLITEEKITLFAGERRAMENKYREIKLKSKKSINVLGASANGVLDDFIKDKKLRERFFENNLSVKILFMYPDDIQISSRSVEDGRTNL